MATREQKPSSTGSSNGAEGIRVAHESPNERENRPSTHEQIRMRAFELYLERGTLPDDSLEDWLQAEREFRRSPDESTTAQRSFAH